jgi:hypothetical protein
MGVPVATYIIAFVVIPWVARGWVHTAYLDSKLPLP